MLHLRHRAFEYPATAGRKQRVTAEQQPAVRMRGIVIGQVAQRMTGHGKHLQSRTQPGQLNHITLTQTGIRCREPGNLFMRRRMHPQLRKMPTQFGDPANVVGMVMRDENVAELQIFLLQTSQHGLRFAWIDNSHFCAISRVGAAQQPDVIIRQTDCSKRQDAIGWAGFCIGVGLAVHDGHSRAFSICLQTLEMPIHGFDDWLETPQGQYVLHWEQARYDQLVADIFGFNAVQLGLPQHDFLRANRMPFRLYCDDLPGDDSSLAAAQTTTHKLNQLITDPHLLPFASASMDLVILPHLLEFHVAPHQILREVERVLVPEGSVIVTGFNPFSLWGLRRQVTRTARAMPPWRGHYLSVRRLKDWFALLDMETHSGSFGCYAPPFSQENHLQRWRFIELAGNRWWPYAGATYIIQAIKRHQGMRLVAPGWRERMLQARALAGVAPQPRPRPSPQNSTAAGTGTGTDARLPHHQSSRIT